MTAALAVILGLLVIAGLIYGPITQIRRRDAQLAARRAERERTGEAERLRQIHAEREAQAADDD